MKALWGGFWRMLAAIAIVGLLGAAAIGIGMALWAVIREVWFWLASVSPWASLSFALTLVVGAMTASAAVMG